MKKLLVVLATLGLSFAANATDLEVQMTGSFNGTNGTIKMNDKDTGDNTPWGLGAEVYTPIADNMQIGGILNVKDDDKGGDTQLTLGVLGRYNIGDELRNSMFVGAGVTYSDFGASDSIAAHLSFGKRYALSDTITWTPNVAVNMRVAGDLDKGTQVVFNLISFSGFMSM